MIILCEYCDLRYICYDDWMDHLLSNGHQDVISKTIDSWEVALNERSLVIKINGPKPEKTDICWYFANYGLVSNVFFQSDLDFCVIQLDKKDYAVNALSLKHKIEKTDLSIRLKADISNAEWLVLNTVGKNADFANKSKESFENRHMKLAEKLKELPLNRQMEHFEREIKMTETELNLRQELMLYMNNLFSREYSNCILCPYGSFVTGLGSESSVLHMYLDAKGLSSQEGRFRQDLQPSKEGIMDFIERRIEMINRKQLFCHDFILLPRDPTPCIKFTHYLTGVSCRFTFDSLLPTQTSKLIALILKLDERLPTLFLLISYWGQFYKLTGPQLISHYSVNLLILVFLTMKKIIPSVAALKSMGGCSKEINGWETGFCDDKDKIINVMSFLGLSSSYEKNSSTGRPSAKSILLLAIDFFKLYAHSDLQSQVICSTIGELLPKVLFERDNEVNLPKGLEEYKTRVSILKSRARLNTKTLLCIQDPFDLGSNISCDTPDEIVWKFQFTCADTIEHMEAVLNSSNLNLMDIFHLKPANDTKTKPSTSQNIVASSSNYHQLPAIEHENVSSHSSQSSLYSAPFEASGHQFDNNQGDIAHTNLFACPEPESRNKNTFDYENYHTEQQDSPSHHHGSDVFHQHDPQQYNMRENYSNAEQYGPSQDFDQYSSHYGHETNSWRSQYCPSNQTIPPVFPNVGPPQRHNSGSLFPLPPHLKKLPLSVSHIAKRTLVAVPSTSKSTLPIVPPPPIMPKKKSRSRKIKFPAPGVGLRFGTYERLILYPPDEGFVTVFNENFGNLAAEETVKGRLNVLWGMYMKDMFIDLCSKSFSFEGAEISHFDIPTGGPFVKKEVANYIPRRVHDSTEASESEEPPCEKKPKVDEDFTEDCQIEPSIKYSFSPDTNPYKKKFFDVPMKFTYNNAFIITFNSNFAVGRGKFRYSTIHDPELIKRFPNPLELEAEVSRLFALNKGKSIAKNSGINIDIVLKISIDALNDEIVTVVYKHVQNSETVVDPKTFPGTIQNTVNHILAVARTVTPNYSLYRFKNWLGKLTV